MKRRSRAGGKSSKTTTLRRRSAPKSTRHLRSLAAGASEQVALYKRERDEALEQLSAASEVLKVISSSPGDDLEGIFESILENATRICGTKAGILFRYANGGLHCGRKNRSKTRIR